MKNIYLDEPGKPVKDADIRDFEEKFGLVIPISLIKLLKKANGGFHGAEEFEELFTLKSINGEDASISFTLNTLFLAEELIPAGFVPFGNDDGGWVLLLDSNPDGGKVYIFTNDGELLELADSLEEYFGVEDISEIEFHSEE